jgi:hypothetical protein
MQRLNAEPETIKGNHIRFAIIEMKLSPKGGI